MLSQVFSLGGIHRSCLVCLRDYSLKLSSAAASVGTCILAPETPQGSFTGSGFDFWPDHDAQFTAQMVRLYKLKTQGPASHADVPMLAVLILPTGR